MNTTPSSHSHSRALVLGGGGSAGNAWLIGVLAGLSEAGTDVSDADLTIGTSAGATAAAQLAGASAAPRYADILNAPPMTSRPAGPAPMMDHLQRTTDVIAASTDGEDMRRRLAASALELDDDGSWSARWRGIVASRLTRHEWPDNAMLLTAVDARTAEPVEFDRASGLDLVDAVAASTAGGPPYHVGGQLYIDGGYRRSSENADLAAGCDRVLVLSPLGGRTRAPLSWGLHLEVQIRELRAGGSTVETIVPDAASLAAFGSNMMDYSTRPAAARAGHAQGATSAERISGFWGT